MRKWDNAYATPSSVIGSILTEYRRHTCVMWYGLYNISDSIVNAYDPRTRRQTAKCWSLDGEISKVFNKCRSRARMLAIAHTLVKGPSRKNRDRITNVWCPNSVMFYGVLIWLIFHTNVEHFSVSHVKRSLICFILVQKYIEKRLKH